MSSHLVNVFRRSLPAGRPLPGTGWRPRHLALTGLLGAHVLALLIVAAATGELGQHGPSLVAIATLAVAGSVPSLRRGWREAAVTIGLLASSALIVTAAGGRTEAHAHVFLVLALVTLYQSWTPYLLAIFFASSAYLLLAAIDPSAVFSAPEAQAAPFRWAGLHVLAVAVASAIFLTAWRLAETERERSDRVMDATADGIFGLDARGRITFANAATARMLGVDVDDLLGADHHLAMSHGTPDGLAVPSARCRLCAAVADADGTHTADDTFGRLDGTRFPIELSANPITRHGHVDGTVVTVTDLTEQATLTRRALHDPLTGLPNRVLFLDHLERAIARLRRHSATVAVMFVDLDRFKVINDSLGHTAGDELLEQVAQRLLAVMRAHDTVARFGGDEFVILCDDLTDEQQAIVIAERLVAALSEPYVLQSQEVFCSASIGITLGRRSGRTMPAAEDMLRDADAAMYRAKDSGRNTFELFDEGMRERAVTRLTLEQDLRRALAADEIEVHYQPKVSLASGKIIGMEALARWTHPTRGAVSPVEFIPLAEETGLIAQLGLQVLRRACIDSETWRRARKPWADLLISVNVSGRQLALPSLAEDIAAVLAETGVEPRNVCLEITETVLMSDLDVAVGALDALKTLGVQIAVDDFGTGYSSLAYLTRFPVDTLKVDRSFVDRLGAASLGDSQSRSVVSAVIGLAKALGMHTVAEGVEEATQLSALRELGCEVAQGFLLARPMPARQLESLLIDGLAMHAR